MTREQKLERWAEREIQRNLHNLILDSDQGRVLAFGRWEINRGSCFSQGISRRYNRYKRKIGGA